MENMSQSIPGYSTNAKKRQIALDRELKRWLPILIDSLAPERNILFGSLNRGQVSEWSDIDLVVIQDTDLPFLKRIQQVFSLLLPKVGLDILVYTPQEYATLVQERRFVRDEIASKGRIIYERGTQ
jgi:predicted nucleotidyltransferase